MSLDPDVERVCQVAAASRARQELSLNHMATDVEAILKEMRAATLEIVRACETLARAMELRDAARGSDAILHQAQDGRASGRDGGTVSPTDATDAGAAARSGA